jgi:L-malate glycosyltransferase
MVFWLHKDTMEAMTLPAMPGMVIKTSPVQGAGRVIWSTGGVDRFLKIEKKPHDGFNIGMVFSPKMHPEFISMCHDIAKAVPGVHFIILGDDTALHPAPEYKGNWKTMPSRIYYQDGLMYFFGKVDDIAPYLAEMDLFFYPLRPDHYGTCEQVLGEAMAAGVVPIAMDNPSEALIIEDNVSGILLKQKESLHYKAMVLFLHSRVRNWMVANARKRAEGLYSIDTMISNWDKVFEEMMEEPK